MCSWCPWAPVEYGGTGWSATQRHIWAEELQRADTAPIIAFSTNLVGPVIYTFGTPEQKARFLPRIVAGDDWWCQGYSEPGAGSDLASLQTRAAREGDHYVVNGQKTWTTLAQHADWGFFLVRTDPSARKQAVLPGDVLQAALTADHVLQLHVHSGCGGADGKVGQISSGERYAGESGEGEDLQEHGVRVLGLA